MKKSLVIFSVISLAIAMSGLTAIAQEAEDPIIGTGLTRSAGGGEAPVVKVKWEMWDYGKDDSCDPGAQFKPWGKFEMNKRIKVCAVVTDPDGVSDINAVYGDIWYPEKISLGPSHESEAKGCGQMLGTECKMEQLTKPDGYNLICNAIRTFNNNLPVFENGYDYDEICAQDGELWKEEAYVYCCDRELSYEDPAGEYKTLVFAQDKAGVDSNYLVNYFEYLPLAAFEVDFKYVNYGTVKLNTHKIISGDLTWNGIFNDGMPATVRNVGTVRLQMSVEQNDMGLGKTGDEWNVKYDARVGNYSFNWTYYYPEQKVYLMDDLDLSEMDEMDFSIEIYKFPPYSGNEFKGAMKLGAKGIEHLPCRVE